jgi:DNA-binding Xre family transcriptional regulator
MTETELRWLLRGMIIERFGSLKKYAAAKGVSPAYISSIMTKGKNIPDSMLDEFGYERHIIYSKKELEPA